MRKWHKQPQLAKIDLSVFSFLFLVLLAISTLEILTNPFSYDAGASIRLPRTIARAYQLFQLPMEQNAIAVLVARNGRISIGNHPINAFDLTANLSNSGVRKIYIFADAHAKYAYVKIVIDAAHDAELNMPASS